MKTTFKHKVVAMTLTLMMTASIIWGAALTTDETISNKLEKPVAEIYMDNEKIDLHNVAETEHVKAAKEKNAQAVRDVEEVETRIIGEVEIPMAGVTEDGSSWALLNLIIAILTGIVSAVLLAGYLCIEESEGVNEGERAERKSITRLMSLIPAVSAVIFFALTENMNNPIVLTDRWTILMAAIMMIQKGAVLLVKKSEGNNEGAKIIEAVNA